MDESVKREAEIYIHVPFCVQKCKYCDFFSGPFGEEEEKAYFETLSEEIAACPFTEDTGPVRSIYFGGGTPGKTDPERIGGILEKIRGSFQVRDDAEITLEVNPGTVDFDKLKHFRDKGINRLSVGCQSADDGLLRKLGRIHTFQDFLRIFSDARKAGFDNISVDLISGIPGLTLSVWENTLDQILSLRPEHISAYSLIVEEGTPFYALYSEDAPCFQELPSEDEDREMVALTDRLLKMHGYHQYEISNYALPGFESLHNKGYWEGVRYLGFGASAASYVPAFSEDGRLLSAVRFQNASSLSYLDRPYIETETLKPGDLLSEFMILGLRMNRGVEDRVCRERFGVSFFEKYEKVIAKYRQAGVLLQEKDRIFLSPYGRDISNLLFEEFI